MRFAKYKASTSQVNPVATTIKDVDISSYNHKIILQFDSAPK